MSRRQLIQTIALATALAALTIPHTRALESLGFDIHGYVDARAGTRLRNDPYERDTSLAESRLQLDLMRFADRYTLKLQADITYDAVAEDTHFDLDTGKGGLDLRQANVLFTPASMMDVKIGRQILTWGTGDLIFLNDLFPKDWQAFFLGRDEDYLKAPSDAIFVSFFPAFADIDIAYTPQFDPDRYVRGERLSYWNPMLGRLAGRDAPIEPEMPDDWFQDHELALRLSRMIRSYELALYGYHGFWKSPEGVDPATMNPEFPRLNVWGASIRGPLAAGIANVEGAYYHSREDTSGENPWVPNSEFRFLAGYEQEAARDFTVAMQYYAEWMMHYDEFSSAAPATALDRDRVRHTVTLRLTRLLMNQDLVASLFSRYSLSDQDLYMRPTLTYAITDQWEAGTGANLFFGQRDRTFLGQFSENTNVYGWVRYYF